MKTFYRLWINDKPGEDHRFSLRNDDRDYLKERAEEWKRLNFIASYLISKHEEAE